MVWRSLLLRRRRTLTRLLLVVIIILLLLVLFSCVLEYFLCKGSSSSRRSYCSRYAISRQPVSKRSASPKRQTGGRKSAPLQRVETFYNLHTKEKNLTQKATHVRSFNLTQTNKTFDEPPSSKNATISNTEITARLISFAKEVISQKKGPLLLTIINMGYLPMTYNWLCHTVGIPDVHDNIVFLVQGQAAEAKLKSKWPKLKTITVHESEDELKTPLKFGTVGYVRMMIRRTKLLNSLILANLSFVLFETDFIWFKNPVPDVIEKGEKEDLDIVGTISTAPTQIMCGAFIYFRNTPRMRALWGEVTRQILKTGQQLQFKPDSAIAPVHHNEQVYLNKLLEKKYAGARYGLTEYHIVVDGKWYWMDKDTRRKMQPKAIHNNFLTTTKAKIRRFMAFKQWVLNSNLACDPPKVRQLMARGPK